MAKARIDIEVVDRANAQRRLAQITQAERGLNTQFKGGFVTSEQLRRSTDRLSRARALLTRRLNTNSASLRRANRSAATMTTTLGSLRSIALGLGVTFGAWQVARILSSTASAAIDFRAEFANVSTLINTETPKGVKQLKLLEQQILALDSRLGGATELTRGLYQALSAGADPANAVRLVGEAALFAKAGLTDTFTAVDILTTILNAYGAAAGSAEQVSSTLFATIKEGKTTGPELARSLGRVIPPAAALNVTLAEVNAAVATLTKGGFATSEAVTSLVQVFRAFLKPTAAAQKVFEKMGITAEQMRQIIGEKGLSAALRLLQERTGGNIAQMSLFFESSEALNAVLALTGSQASEYSRILGVLKQAQEDATATQIGAQKQFDTTKSKVAELSAELEKLKIALNLDQAAERAVILLTNLARVASDAAKAFFAVLSLSINAARKSIGEIPQALADTSKALDDLQTPTKKLGQSQEQAAGAVAGHKKALEEFTASTFPAELRLIQLALAAEKETKALAELDRQVKALGTIPQLSQGDLQLLGLIDDLKAAKEQEVELTRQAEEMQRAHEQAFRRMESAVDSFFTQTFLGARSLSDVWNSVTQQMLRVFLSTVAKMVAGWLLGMRQMQAASAGGGGGGGIGSILSGVFGGGGLGGIFGGGTGPGGTPPFNPSVPATSSQLISAGGGLSAFGVPGIGVPTGLPPAPAGSASGITAQQTLLGRLGINLRGIGPIPGGLVASGGILAALFGIQRGSPLIGALGGAAAGFAFGGPIGAIIGALVGGVAAIFSRGKNKRKAAASEEVLTQQLGEVIAEFKTFQTDLQGALASIDQLFEAFQGQVKPLGKAGRNAVKNISPLVGAVKSRLTEIQATRDARLLLSAGSLIPEFHSGGLVPSLLQPGEFVVQRSAVQQVGVQNLERINRGETPAGNVNINITINPSPGMDERAVGEMAARAIRRSFRNRGLQFGG